MSDPKDAIEMLENLNATMAKEEQVLLEGISNIQAILDGFLENLMPPVENRPPEQMVTIVNVKTGEERQVTESELDEMIASSKHQDG